MGRETAELADYAVGLEFDDIPPAVVERAKECIADTIAVSVFGSGLPWSGIVARYAARGGHGGRATVLGPGLTRATAPMAALANGAFSHAFEMDSLRYPSAGVHPGAALAIPGLAVAEDVEATGRQLITAFVAGSEVLSRIGLAGRHSSEPLGFHAPGLTGPFGSAVVAGRLLGLDPERLVNALGIAGSLSSGILEFVRSGSGGMVKRLHLGRAAEGGVLAASLAQDGMAGPATVLEGDYGFLNVFCQEHDASLLTAGLGSTFETMNICLKRFACHITAHTPVQAVHRLRAQHEFEGADVESVVVRGSQKMVSHHDITEPADIQLGQYSTPFCVAVALYRDPLDPRSFLEDSLHDDSIRALCRRVQVEMLAEVAADAGPLATEVEVKLKDGRTLERQERRFPGMPEDPLGRSALLTRFELLTASMDPEWRAEVGEALFRLEDVDDVAGVLRPGVG